VRQQPSLADADADGAVLTAARAQHPQLPVVHAGGEAKGAKDDAAHLGGDGAVEADVVC
jgi:hypothetical protein